MNSIKAEITVNSHSSIKIRGSKTLWFDPFQLENEDHSADIIFITHSHYDHLSPEDIEKVRTDGTVTVCPKSVDWPAEVKLAPGETAMLGDVEIEAVPAYNIGKAFHPKENNWLGYKVTLDGESFYVCGDSDITPEAEQVKCDVLLVPCGGKYTMNVAEAAELAGRIAPALSVPTHYGSITGSRKDGAEFCRILSESGLRAEECLQR